MIKELRENKDPVILTVLVEYAAALLGIIIVTVSLFLSDLTGNTAYDAIGSILIGMVLMIFALYLARENRGMLIGESISKRDFKKIYDEVATIKEVQKIISIRTMHLAPDDALIAIEASMIENLNTDSIESVIAAIEAKITNAVSYANPSKIYVELVDETR